MDKRASAAMPRALSPLRSRRRTFLLSIMFTIHLAARLCVQLLLAAGGACKRGSTVLIVLLRRKLPGIWPMLNITVEELS